MATFEINLVINRPVEEVFAFISNPENQPRWRATTLEMSRTSSEPLGVGSIFKGTVLARQSITVNNGAVNTGSFLARIGAVTLQKNTVTRAQ